MPGLPTDRGEGPCSVLRGLMSVNGSKQPTYLLPARSLAQCFMCTVVFK
jgi:hypothetical protein